MGDVQLVLLPGLDGSGRMFDAMRSRLHLLDPAMHAAVIAYPPEPRDYAALEALVRGHLPSGRYVIFAESFSGPIAMRLAAERPPGLVGLILCSTFAAPPRRWLRHLRPLLEILARTSSRAGPRVPRSSARLAARLLLPDAAPTLRNTLADALREIPAGTIAARLACVATVDVRSDLAACAVPILLIRGSRDRLLGRRATRELAWLVPRASTVTIDAPHLVAQNNPAASADALREFIMRSVRS